MQGEGGIGGQCKGKGKCKGRGKGGDVGVGGRYYCEGQGG